VYTVRRGVLALSLSVVLVAGAGAPAHPLTLSVARGRALSSAASVTGAVPRATGYKVGTCARVSDGKVSCPFQVFIRALSGGTITCTSHVEVYSVVSAVRQGSRTVDRVSLSTTFPGHLQCVRKPPPRSGAGGSGGG
jgi:hypothetical protein